MRIDVKNRRQRACRGERSERRRICSKSDFGLWVEGFDVARVAGPGDGCQGGDFLTQDPITGGDENYGCFCRGGSMSYSAVVQGASDPLG